MHLQVRFQPRSSPPDVEKALRKLAQAGVNLIGVGGSNLEFGGEMAVAPEHGQEQLAMDALAEYHPRLVDSTDPESGLTVCVAEHHSGGLHACLEAAATDNLGRGRIIRDIVVGVPYDAQHSAGQVEVQIYSEAVRTPQNL